MVKRKIEDGCYGISYENSVPDNVFSKKLLTVDWCSSQCGLIVNVIDTHSEDKCFKMKIDEQWASSKDLRELSQFFKKLADNLDLKE